MAIALERDRLTIFVFGPGEGEAVAVWLPGHGWLFVDACRRSVGKASIVPQLECRKLAADAPTWGLVLTHPHEDHVDGFADLIAVTKPERVFVTGTASPARDLVTSVERSLIDAENAPNDTRRKRLAKVVHSAAVAIREWEAVSDRRVTALHAGVNLLDECDLRVDCIAPEQTAIVQLLSNSKSHELSTKANHLSIVLAITFRSTRVLLTGDLPWVETGSPVPAIGSPAQNPIPSGWEFVAARYGLTHHALKVPHHASREALHPTLLAYSTHPRSWVVTPKNRSELPRFWAPSNGVDTLLAMEQSILVTSKPSSWFVPSPMQSDGVIPRSALARRTKAQPTSDPFLNDGNDARPTNVDPHNAFWALVFDGYGDTQKIRGTEALIIER